MDSLFTNFGFEIPLSLLLMALLGLRAKVWPKASLYINAAPHIVFDMIDMGHGKVENWGRTTTLTEQVEPGGNLYRKTYTTTLTTGVAKTSSALFSHRLRQVPTRLEVAREGLEGRSLNNELLSQTYVVTPQGNGTKLSIAYEWGPRPFLAQLIARADLWGGLFRLKSLAETGRPSDLAYQLITAGVSVITGAIALAAFALLFNWAAAGLMIIALFIHELGHLLAYRLMGQPWGRMIFLPFLGAMAIPRLPFDSQAQGVFAALMGPGFSVLLAVVCASHVFFDGTLSAVLVIMGLITAALNIFNLLPVEPLDGGVALRSVLARYMGRYARFGLMGIGVILIAIGLYMSQLILVIFGGIAILFNLKARVIDAGLVPLTRMQVVITFFSYVCMVGAYITLLRHYFESVELLQALT
jgi:Zn-dependent protease